MTKGFFFFYTRAKATESQKNPDYIDYVLLKSF